MLNRQAKHLVLAVLVVHIAELVAMVQYMVVFFSLPGEIVEVKTHSTEFLFGDSLFPFHEYDLIDDPAVSAEYGVDGSDG